MVFNLSIRSTYRITILDEIKHLGILICHIYCMKPFALKQSHASVPLNHDYSIFLHILWRKKKKKRKRQKTKVCGMRSA